MREASFRRLVASHLDLLYGAALRMTGRPDHSEDLVQETCRIAFERWTTLRDPAACRAWLLRILRNAHIDELRRTRRLVPIDGEAFELPDLQMAADPARSVAAGLTIGRLDALLANLPAETRWLFWLREVEGFSYAELAEALEVPIGTVRSRLARLRVRLIAGLAGVEQQPPRTLAGRCDEH